MSKQLFELRSWLSRTGAEAHTQELAQSLRVTRPLEIQIVDTPESPEIIVNAGFTVGRQQIDRTLVISHIP